MTASGHSDLPGGQGNAYADGVTGSGQKTADVHAESGHGVTGIDPRIETGHVETESGSSQTTATALGVSGHEKRATRTMTGVHALDLLTTNGKRSESENDGDVHESYSFVTWPSYPSVLLDPKNGNHRRITRGSKTPKSLSNSHVVERAVRIGERQPSWRRGKRESAASGQLPLRPHPKEKEKRERAPDDCLEALPPLSLDLDRARGEGAPQTQHQVHPETPPASPAPLKGGKKKKKKSQGAKLPKKFPRGERSAAQGEQSLKGEISSFLYKNVS